MQDQELSQQIEQLIEMTDMELKQKPQHEYFDLMLRAPQVIPQSPPPSAVEPAPSDMK